jgi:hypothetical protein
MRKATATSDSWRYRFPEGAAASPYCEIESNEKILQKTCQLVAAPISMCQAAQLAQQQVVSIIFN